jgi:hypothetical protein
MLLDRLVHQRLSEGRLVSFVVAMPPVAPHVDDRIPFEDLTELHREGRRLNNRLGIVAVHVHDGRLDGLGQVRWVRAGPRGHRIGGEPNLVVYDQVHRATGLVALEFAELQRFGNHALCRERRIAVHKQTQNVTPVHVATLMLA